MYLAGYFLKGEGKYFEHPFGRCFEFLLEERTEIYKHPAANCTPTKG
jgi:hypothetical protein